MRSNTVIVMKSFIRNHFIFTYNGQVTHVNKSVAFCIRHLQIFAFKRNMTQSKSAVAVSHKYVIQYQIEKHFKPLKMFCRVVTSEADIKRVGVGPLIC